MRKSLIAALSLVVAVFLFLAWTGERVDETAPIAAAPDPGARPAESGESAPSTPLPESATEAPGSENKAPPDSDASPPLKSESPAATAIDLDEMAAEFNQLAEHNKAQLYNVLWHALDTGKMGSADFREFILATIEELGDDAPGKVLVALVQNAPTPALRESALRLLDEASGELSVDLFNEALEDPNPAIRQSSREFLNEMGATEMFSAVTAAVSDSNQAVRLRALKALDEMHEFAPVWEVAETVVNDPDPEIRMLALELLTYGDRQRAIDRLILALGDPDPEIRELAEDLLDELDEGPF
jgi:HEAT repeat protein